MLLLLCFFAFLHCWLNLFGELLRFADRMFYKVCGTVDCLSTHFALTDLLFQMREYLINDLWPYQWVALWSHISLAFTFILYVLAKQTYIVANFMKLFSCPKFCSKISSFDKPQRNYTSKCAELMGMVFHVLLLLLDLCFWERTTTSLSTGRVFKHPVLLVLVPQWQQRTPTNNC